MDHHVPGFLETDPVIHLPLTPIPETVTGILGASSPRLGAQPHRVVDQETVSTP